MSTSIASPVAVYEPRMLNLAATIAALVIHIIACLVTIPYSIFFSSVSGIAWSVCWFVMFALLLAKKNMFEGTSGNRAVRFAPLAVLMAFQIHDLITRHKWHLVFLQFPVVLIMYCIFVFGNMGAVYVKIGELPIMSPQSTYVSPHGVPIHQETPVYPPPQSVYVKPN